VVDGGKVPKDLKVNNVDIFEEGQLEGILLLEQNPDCERYEHVFSFFFVTNTLD